jgi:hypothetical protein
MSWMVVTLTVLLAALRGVVPATANDVYFDDSDPDLMVLGNGTSYEIGFRKSNGAIASITDKATGQQVSLGSR